MSKGGARPGAGRKRGSGLAKKTRTIAKREHDSGELVPLEVMLKTMRGHAAAGEWDKAHACAKDAAPYMHARLAAHEHTGKNGGPITTLDLTKLSDEQLGALEPVLQMLAADHGEKPAGKVH